MSTERIFVIGATGEIGSRLVKSLVKSGIRTTAYIRDENKGKEIFKDEISSDYLNIVVGDYSTTDVYRKSIEGHSRLFLLVLAKPKPVTFMKEIKESLAKIAYEQGVRQIVDLSSYTVRHFGRQGIIGYLHTTAEEVLRKIAEENPHQRSLVTLRPGTFMTNHLMTDFHSIKNLNKISSVGSPSSLTTWIDPEDISDVAIKILSEPIEKHHFMIYEMGSQTLTNDERANILSQILGRTITYEQESIETVYQKFIQFGLEHSFAYDLISLGLDDQICASTPQLSILINRPLRTLEDWLNDHINLLQ